MLMRKKLHIVQADDIEEVKANLNAQPSYTLNNKRRSPNPTSTSVCPLASLGSPVLTASASRLRDGSVAKLRCFFNNWHTIEGCFVD